MAQIVIHGTVVTGLQEGRTLGFPTINISYDNPENIPSGVYAAVLEIDGGMFRGAAVIGGDFRIGPHPKCEIHLLDINYSAIVSAPATATLCERVNDVFRCQTIDDLRVKIAHDITNIRTHFASHLCLAELSPTSEPL